MMTPRPRSSEISLRKLLPLVGAMMTRTQAEPSCVTVPVAAPRRGDDDLGGKGCSIAAFELLPLVGAMMTARPGRSRRCQTGVAAPRRGDDDAQRPPARGGRRAVAAPRRGDDDSAFLSAEVNLLLMLLPLVGAMMTWPDAGG